MITKTAVRCFYPKRVQNWLPKRLILFFREPILKEKGEPSLEKGDHKNRSNGFSPKKAVQKLNSLSRFNIQSKVTLYLKEVMFLLKVRLDRSKRDTIEPSNGSIVVRFNLRSTVSTLETDLNLFLKTNIKFSSPKRKHLFLVWI